ncbi:unnamed protein product, partial [Mesorhabditis belari]|uniref:SAM domain-containing protein n=1 Tax=Mesorhabditis belari TaxID=2138241 RepID=A0AAF3J6R4_9BILA
MSTTSQDHQSSSSSSTSRSDIPSIPSIPSTPSFPSIPSIPSIPSSTQISHSPAISASNMLRSILTGNHCSSSTSTSSSSPSSSTIPPANSTANPSIGNIFPVPAKEQQQFQAPMQLQQVYQPNPSHGHHHHRQQQQIVLFTQPPITNNPQKRQNLPITTIGTLTGTTFPQSKIKMQGRPNQKAPSHLVPVNPQMLLNGQFIQILPYGAPGMTVTQTAQGMKMMSPVKPIDGNAQSGSNHGTANGLQAARVCQPSQLLQMLPGGVFRSAQAAGGQVIYTVASKSIPSTIPRGENGIPKDESHSTFNQNIKKEETTEETPPTLSVAASEIKSSPAAAPIPVKKASTHELHIESALLFRGKRGPNGIIKHHIDGIVIEESDEKFPLDSANKLMDLLPENVLKKTFPQHIKKIEKIAKKRGRPPTKVKEEAVNDENERISNVIIDRKHRKRTIKEEPMNEEGNFDEPKSMNSSNQSFGSPSSNKKRPRVSEVEKLKNFDFGPKEQGPRILETLSRSEDKKRQSTEKEQGKGRKTRKSSDGNGNGDGNESFDSTELRQKQANRGSLESATTESPNKNEQKEASIVVKLSIPPALCPSTSSTSPSTSTIGLPEISNGTNMCTFCKNPLNEIRLPSYPQFCSKRCVNEFRIHKNHAKRPERTAAQKAEHMRNVDNLLSTIGSSQLAQIVAPKISIESESPIVTLTSKNDELSFVDSLPLKDWQTQHVWKWIRSVTGSDEVANNFKAEEIDGDSLSMVKNEDLRNTFNMKLGPALKLGNCLEELKGLQKKFK